MDFENLIDDLSVQGLLMDCMNLRAHGWSWDEIEADLERLEDEAMTELEPAERRTFIDGCIAREVRA
jgi:hypothetical protein